MARADELKRLLLLSAATSDSNPDRCHITNLEHNLRVATLAKRYVPEDPDIIFMALVHDLARPLNDVFHGEVIAWMVKDMVHDSSFQVLFSHGQYQSDYIHGTRLVDETTPWHHLARALCAWEIGSFNKHWGLPTMTLDEAHDVIDSICKGRD